MAPILAADSLILAATQVRLNKLNSILYSSQKLRPQRLLSPLQALAGAFDNLQYLTEAFDVPTDDESLLLVASQINVTLSQLFAHVKVYYPSIRMGVSPRWYRKMAVRRLEITSDDEDDLLDQLHKRLSLVEAVNACFNSGVYSSDPVDVSVFDDTKDT